MADDTNPKPINLKGIFFLFIGLLSSIIMLIGCTKKTQNAIVIGKEHIAAHVEGTEYKERELDHEQWLVAVQMENGQRATAPVDESQWRALKVGDHVHAKYSQGKYSGTIWGIDIQEQ